MFTAIFSFSIRIGIIRWKINYNLITKSIYIRPVRTVFTYNFILIFFIFTFQMNEKEKQIKHTQVHIQILKCQNFTKFQFFINFKYIIIDSIVKFNRRMRHPLACVCVFLILFIALKTYFI